MQRCRAFGYRGDLQEDFAALLHEREGVRIPAAGICTSPLDPIDPSLPACLQTENIYQRYKLRCSWVAKAYAATNDSCYFRNYIANPHPACEKVITPATYASHVRDLVNSNILRQIPRDERRTIQGYARMFPVQKTESTSRAVFDCAHMNEHYAPPPHYSCIATKRIAEVLAHVPATALLATIDLRHWFYQVPISNAAQFSAIIATQQDLFAPQVMPMGWNWSGYAGQAFAWAVALGEPNKWTERGIAEDSIPTDDMPQFVWLYSNPTAPQAERIVCGALFVFADGILVAADGTELQQNWHRHLNRPPFNARAKTTPTFDTSALFMGLQWHMCFSQAHRICYLLPTPKVDEWQAAISAFATQSTATLRDAAKIMGIITHVHQLRGFSVPSRSDHFDAALRTMKPWLVKASLSTPDIWDKDIAGAVLSTVQTAASGTAHHLLDFVMAISPRQYPPAETVVFICTDASLQFTAWCVSDHTADAMLIARASATHSLSQCTLINETELMAALLGIQTALQHFPRMRAFHLFTDSVTARAQLRTQTTTLPRTTAVLRTVLAACAHLDFTEFHYVNTRNNPVDSLTRNATASHTVITPDHMRKLINTVVPDPSMQISPIPSIATRILTAHTLFEQHMPPADVLQRTDTPSAIPLSAFELTNAELWHNIARLAAEDTAESLGTIGFDTQGMRPTIRGTERQKRPPLGTDSSSDDS